MTTGIELDKLINDADKRTEQRHSESKQQKRKKQNKNHDDEFIPTPVTLAAYLDYRAELLDGVKEPRDKQVMVRLTASEKEELQLRALSARLKQADYIRHAILNKRIIVKETPPAFAEGVDALHAINAHLGKIGGLLKSTIKPNEGSSNISRNEWETVFAAIRDIEHINSDIRSSLAKL